VLSNSAASGPKLRCKSGTSDLRAAVSGPVAGGHPDRRVVARPFVDRLSDHRLALGGLSALPVLLTVAVLPIWRPREKLPAISPVSGTAGHRLTI